MISPLKQITFTLLLFFSVFLQGQDAAKPTHLFELKTRQDFDKLKGLPLTENFKGIECVKVIYVLSEKKLYYLESKKYRWHYRFAVEVLGDTDELNAFNTKNYSVSSGRKYILATFNYNVNTKNYFLQFSVADNPSDALINELAAKVTATFFKANQFKILLNSTILLSRKKEISVKHQVMTSDELFKNQTYQSICTGKTRGILKFVHADSLSKNVDYSACIIILNGSSNEIPVCKGLVTNEFQTPLSHICLLTNNRKTPAAAKKTIFNDDSLKKYNGKMVELSVGNDKFSIKPISGPDLTISIKRKHVKLSADTSVNVLADLITLGYKNKNAYGSKVCNLAELKKLQVTNPLIETPPAAFAIPFCYYGRHLKDNDIDRKIKEFLADSTLLKNDSLLEENLKSIRKAIKEAPIDKQLLEKVTEMCSVRFGNAKVRFRSSSNCEDEANFNGAGLYTSQTGIVGDEKKSIENAIKKVWASAWNSRAFKERAYFNIEHANVYMGVLVHGAYDNEYANGVAITRNLYRNIEYGFVINMQKGEEEVVSPKPNVVCEQVVSYMNTGVGFYNDNRSADWISFSSLNPNGSLLSTEELFAFTKQLEAIKQHFYKVYNVSKKIEYKHFALDVEFKVIEKDGKKKFVYKQARPFNN